MKLRIYLDTSVFSALHDDRAPDRKLLSEDFWDRLNEFEVSTSSLALQEINQTRDDEQKNSMRESLANIHVFEIVDGMRELARKYISSGAFSEVMLNDAIHVAVATLNRQDVLVSWNFKHLVNQRRRAVVNSVNINCGLPTISILAPPEV